MPIIQTRQSDLGCIYTELQFYTAWINWRLFEPVPYNIVLLQKGLDTAFLRGHEMKELNKVEIEIGRLILFPAIHP